MNDFNDYKNDPDYLDQLVDVKAKNMGYKNAKECSQSMSGKVLAELLDVAPASLSGAAKKEHSCKGYPVYKWAVRDSKGHVQAYHVPMNIYNSLTDSTAGPRPNPEPNKPNEASNQKATESESESQQESGGGNYNYENISLLPPDQSYVEPATAISVGMMGKSVVENDTANGRSVMYTASAGVGSFMGYKFADDHWIGAILGAVIGLGTAYLGNRVYDQSQAVRSEISANNEKPLAGIESNQPNQPNEPNNGHMRKVDLGSESSHVFGQEKTGSLWK